MSALPDDLRVCHSTNAWEKLLMLRPDEVLSLEVLVNGLASQEQASEDHPLRLLADADVVYAVDPETRKDLVVLGQEKLQEIADSDVPQGARVVRVAIGHAPHHVQRLLDLVRQSKGVDELTESA
jgi:hypothetical protein